MAKKLSKADQQVVKDEAAAEVAFQKGVKKAEAGKQKAAPVPANGYQVHLGGGQYKFVATTK